MSVYFPQGAITLRVMWEDFGEKTNTALQQIYALPIVAKRLTVTINDYATADTFSAEIDYKQFPFDPRCMRACGVSIHMENMGRSFGDDHLPIQLKPTPNNRMFLGFVDEESISFDDTKRTVKLEGRDLTGVLIDRHYTKVKGLDLTQNMEVLIRGLLDELPEARAIQIANRSGEDLPVIAKFAPDFHALGNLRNRQENESYWNVITDLSRRAGLVAYMEIDQLVITKPRALYQRQAALHFIYGKNITDLSYKRKLGRKKNFNIVVRSLNNEKKDSPVIMAEIPKEAKADWSAATGIPAEEVKIPVINTDGSLGTPRVAPAIAFLLPNIVNKDALIERGQEIYEELSRQQIEGTMQTKEMEARDGYQACFDVLRIRNGTPLQIRIDQGDLKGLNQISRLDIEARERFLVKRCYERTVAHALATSLSNERMDSPFYTKAVEFTLDGETGFKAKIDFINFIELPKRLGGTQ